MKINNSGKDYTSELTEEKIQSQLSTYSKKAEKILEDDEKTETLLSKIHSWLDKHRDNKIFGSTIDSVITMVELFADYKDKKYREIPKGAMISLVAGIAYIVSPVDLIPDFIPVAGWLDDIAVIALILKLGVGHELEKYKVWKKAQNITAIKLKAQDILSEAKGRIPDDSTLAAIFLTDDLQIEYLICKRNDKELPLPCKAYLKDISDLKDNTSTEIIAIFKELIDNMDFEWSSLGKFEFMLERDYVNFEDEFDVTGDEC